MGACLDIILVLMFSHCQSIIVLNGTVNSNVPWFLINSEPLVFMRMEYDFSFKYPSEQCCPLFGHTFTLLDEPCFDSEKMKVSLSWSDHILVRLSPGLQGGIATCENILNGTYIQCTGSTKILYYNIRQRHFFLGFGCHEIYSLQGITYDIIVTLMTNSTECGAVDIEDCPDIKYSAFPGPNGDVSVYDGIRTLHYLLNVFGSGGPQCHALIKQGLCNMVFFKCQTLGRQSDLIVPCQESCMEGKEACSKTAASQGHEVALLLKTFPCYYFLPANQSNSCIMYNTFCGPPPAISNGSLITELNETSFLPLAQVGYICDEGYMMEGNSTSFCQYGGHWAPVPICTANRDVTRNGEQFTAILIITLITVLVVIIVLFVFGFSCCMCRRWQKKKRIMNNYGNGDGERNKMYDAFLSYFDDGQNEIHPQKNFVFQTILSHLENVCFPPFNLITHPRDFLAGVYIKENIQKAIWNSNATIILMSKEYAASNWCRYEFEECTFENMEDPAFRMLVILYEPIEDLGDLTPDMISFFRSKTYLTMDDPQLLDKISDVLRNIRGNINEESTQV